MAIMTRIRTELRTIWGTVLYAWLWVTWFLLILAGVAHIMLGLMVTARIAYRDDAVQLGVIMLVITILNGIVYWCGHHVALMPSTRQITEDSNPYLYGVISEQARLAGLPMPVIIESRFADAFATGRSPRHAVLGVSPTLQPTMNHREIRAVLAHEMAHVRNRDALIMTASTTVVEVVLGISLLLGFYGWIGAIILLIPVMSWLREFCADTTSAHLSGDPAALASALDKLPGSSFLSFLRSPYTHPPTKLRVSCLRRLARRTA